ncbi:MAG: hypothetical protein KAZ26_24225 [Caldilineaceae bacterium]|nr:hypothetical protein [Caldilineaceae bacterium]
MNEERILSTTIWGNAASIEMACYDEPLPGEDISDRLHLMIVGSDGNQRGWLMNAQDAVALIRVLAAGIDEVITRGWPMRPLDPGADD